MDDGFGNTVQREGKLQEGRPIQTITFNYTPLNSAMDEIAGNSAYEWYVDFNKVIHYFHVGTDEASIALSDEPDDSDSPPSVFYEGVSRSVDGASLANNIELVGGFTLRVSQEIYPIQTIEMI